jgi:hypothetical protein
MAILLWALALVVWVALGALSVFLIGLFERFTKFRSEGEGVLLLFGPISLVMVLFVLVMVGFFNLIEYLAKSNGLTSIADKIKSIAKGS